MIYCGQPFASPEEALEHLGIKGMHWGHHKPEEIEAKAKKFETQASAYRKQRKILNNQTASSWHKRRQIDKQVKKLSASEQTALSDAENVRAGKMTSRKKKALKGAATVAVLLAAYGTYQAVNSGTARSATLRGREFLTQQHIDPWKKKPGLAKVGMDADEIMRSVVKPINPDYGQIGTKMNCRRATFAYEMRRRGYDVAATRTTNGRGQTIAGMYNSLTPGETDFVGGGRFSIPYQGFKEKLRVDKGKATTKPFTEMLNKAMSELNGGVGEHAVYPNEMFKDLSKLPEGARGELGLGWATGGGHSMAWEVINGKATVFDTQSGIKYTTYEELKKIGLTVANAGYTRLDDKELNPLFLRRWIKGA